MADHDEVWVVVDPEDLLDGELVRAVRSALDGVAAVVEKRRWSPERGGLADRFLRKLSGEEHAEVSGLLEDLEAASPRPRVVVVTRPADAAEVAEHRRVASTETVIVGVDRSPRIEPGWRGAPIDVLLCPDRFAASSVTIARVAPRAVGVPVEEHYRPATDAPAAREAAGLAGHAHVVVIPAGAFDEGDLPQLMVQLALVRVDIDVVFEVSDAAIAAELRRVVPIHGLSACLSPAGERGAGVWGLAHLVLGRAAPGDLWRSRAAGVPFLAAPARSEAERRFADGLVASGAGRASDSVSTLAVDLDLTFEPERWEALADRCRELRVEDPETALRDVLVEALERGPGLAEPTGGLPEGLERIGRRDEARRAGATEHFDEAARAATAVRDKSEMWRQRARLARAHGDEDLAREAEKRAARHREVLDRLLDLMRPEDWSDSREESELEEELEALRRRALSRESVERRLKSLEVEDELRALKAKLELE